jgi:hypothetical protein
MRLKDKVAIVTGIRSPAKPVQTVTAGVPFGRPYNAPFSGEVTRPSPI